MKLASVASALVAAVLSSGSVADAAVRVGQYFEDNFSATCPSGSNGCDVIFPAIAGEKTVLITHVSCRMQISPGAADFVTLGIMTSQETPIARTEALQVSPYSGTWFSALGETLFLYKPGQRPWVRIQVSPQSSIFIGCRIVGQRPSPF